MKASAVVIAFCSSECSPGGAIHVSSGGLNVALGGGAPKYPLWGEELPFPPLYMLESDPPPHILELGYANSALPAALPEAPQPSASPPRAPHRPLKRLNRSLKRLTAP